MPLIIDRTIEINVPAALIWEVITDFPRYGEWNPFCVECSSTLKPGEAIDMLVLINPNKPQRQREWISEHVPGQRFSYAIKPAPLGALTSGRLQEVAAISATRARYHSHFELRGWMAPLVRGLMGKKLEQAFASMLAAMQGRAEALWAQRQKNHSSAV